MASPDQLSANSFQPNFIDLLANPDCKEPLPKGFERPKEADHLAQLYATIPDFADYEFLSFIHAGGSGMQFRVIPKVGGVEQAMKIARSYFFENTSNKTNFSPVSETELKALELFGHPHLVRLFRVIKDPKKGATIALCTTLVKDSLQLDRSLDRASTSVWSKPIRQSDPKCSDIDLRTRFLVEKFTEIASALAHMHEQGVYHFDVKPANILVSVTNEAILTDMGSCIFFSANDLAKDVTPRVTWAYAHPDIRDISKGNPDSIGGGGLRTRATVKADQTIAKFDLFALARTMQECLATVFIEFGQQSFASYSFRFLHLVACLLLDGKNSMDGGGVHEADGHWFVDDLALGYPKGLFRAKKIVTAQDLVRILRRFSHPKDWTFDVPELDFWVANTINTGVGRPVPYTKRVEAIMTHPTMNRLRNEIQLGWIREVFPGAENTRWSHTLGVFGRMVSIYDALLSDPEVPTALIFIDPQDIEIALVAALLHDAGQSSFGHDFENVLSKLEHEKILLRLLDDEAWTPTLRETITRFWPRISMDRVLGVLALNNEAKLTPADGVAADCISGPIDADKQDYLERDSIGCGVPYGKGIDYDRLMRSLTVAVRGESLSLAYKAKGRSAFEGLLFARYHMYTAVYWHHAFRSMQAMFIHAATAAANHEDMTSSDEFVDIFYERVVCGFPWDQAGKRLPALLALVSQGRCKEPKVRKEKAIDLLWLISTPGNRELIERMATRRLHKRIYEANLGDIAIRPENTYADIKEALRGEKRLLKAKQLEDSLVERIVAKKSELSGKVELSGKIAKLRVAGLPLVILDIPTRGIPKEKNIPDALGDPYRKYFTMGGQNHFSRGAKTFAAVQDLQQAMACFRVFAAPEFHDYIVQYLDPDEIYAATKTVLPQVSVP